MRSRISLLAVSCLLVTTSFAGTVKLHGKITHPISDSISVSYSESWVGYEPATIGTRVNKDGTFSLSFPLQYPYTSVTITHGEQATELMPAPGDDLGLTIDAANFDSSLHYSGKGADVANFMAAHMLERNFSNYFSTRIQGASAFSPDSFVVRSRSSLEKEQNFLDKYGAKLPVTFKQHWMANFRYELYVGTLNYPIFHEVNKQKSYNISVYDTADFAPALAVPAAFDDAFLSLSSYRSYISSYYYTRLTSIDRRAGIKPEDHEADVMKLVREHMPPLSAEVFAATHIYYHIGSEPYPKLAERLATFKTQYPKSAFLKVLNEKIEVRKKFAAGSEAMDFTFKTADGRSMKLSDLRGKVVYIDFWATWCGPCKGELPFAKTLEEQYKGKDVVFLYVSIDEDDAAWRKMLSELPAESVQTRDGVGGWKGPIATQYNVQGVPSYFLIDKKGAFAVDNTPRPSSGTELTAEIDKLLK